MAFDRRIWTNGTIEKPCPSCMIGVLVPNEKIIPKIETNASFEMREYNYSSSEFVFSTLLTCNYCKDSVAALGKIEEGIEQDQETGIIESYTIITPTAFFPAPKIIDIPKSCHKSVNKIITESFGLFWMDIGSCANKIRIAIEVLLDELNIPRSETSPKGNIKHLSLNQRIVEFERSNQKVGRCLHAVKWVGNSGSHFSDITINDVLDAYQLMEYSLENLYPEREQNILMISQKIINTKSKPKP